jgi:hypothetical protein
MQKSRLQLPIETAFPHVVLKVLEVISPTLFPNFITQDSRNG